ncbi:MAG: sugar phosphate isomerase/epimerase [Actinobacteria bacterium]|nr:sugar phosphate isomerase/epimerase [Actinomycetota bacterium]
MKLNIDTNIECLGTYAERYVPNGYYEPMEIDKRLETMSKIEGLTGLFTYYPTGPLPSDPDNLVKKLSNFNLKVSNVCVVGWNDKKWKHGAYSTNEKEIRKQAIKLFKEGIDFAKATKAGSVLLWAAHDGFDYSFQVNYKKGWENLKESIKEIGEYDRNVKIAVEYKCKDPRQKAYISNVGKEMMLLNDVGLANVGGVIDVGHALMAQENLAESCVILDSHNKLFQIHINDNYKDADPDLMIGAISFWEILEFMYYLNKTDYEGWLAIDVESPRDDRIRSLEVGVKLIRKYKELADKLTKYSEEIEKNLEGYHFADNMNLIMDKIFK